MSSAERPASKRPLSPHLQVYRPQLTSILSITHRGTALHRRQTLRIEVRQPSRQRQAALRIPKGAVGAVFASMETHF